ncbi:ATP-dependent sacrificial sulfur transferase LarE [Streptomyces sp. NPDC046994]|uniref:ATP-dependent sacrificial sulfur transferase LarE n=1 Tax=Streptomyces sp. NPDC046994 TaxID=3155735 RepID=UPI00345153F0
MMLASNLDEGVQRLRDLLRASGPLLVAFSGGADSALVLAAAVHVLGPDQVFAATSTSASMPRSELAAAREFAADLGVRHLSVETQELRRRDYRANTNQRCYFCKSELLDVLLEVARTHDCVNVATGTNADDARDTFRPGIKAADERSVLAPLRDAGLTKAQVREVSRRWGLRTWDKPAAPCLASRIAYGVPVDEARLGRVERGEIEVRALFEAHKRPLADLRVRDLGGRVRVEVDAAQVDWLADSRLLRTALDRAGFIGTPLDVAPFRSGALNLLPT